MCCLKIRQKGFNNGTHCTYMNEVCLTLSFCQMEINMIVDMQQTLLEKQAVLDHISQTEEDQV